MAAAHWVADADAVSCEHCDAPFTLRVRRHHCRDCGGVYCSACCGAKIEMPHRDAATSKLRVCVACAGYVRLLASVQLAKKSSQVAYDHEHRLAGEMDLDDRHRHGDVDYQQRFAALRSPSAAGGRETTRSTAVQRPMSSVLLPPPAAACHANDVVGMLLGGDVGGAPAAAVTAGLASLQEQLAAACADAERRYHTVAEDERDVLHFVDFASYY
jgi:hypothetical protein